MRIFWNKNVKITQRRGLRPRTPVCLRRLGASPLDPHVITPVCYCKFVEFISIAKCILLPSKKDQNNYRKCFAFASSAAFALISHFKLYILFVDGGARIFLASRRSIPKLRHCLNSHEK